jgi:hypothetical protein
VSDWRKFLGKREAMTLAYFGGTRVRMKDREVRCDAGEPGWFSFEVEGRNAKRLGPADPALEGLTKVRGVLAHDVLFRAGEKPERVELMPEDEPPMFSSAACHRWHDGTLVFGALDFEGEVEEIARDALAERTTIEWVKGASAPLRAAFGWAVVRRASNEKKIPCSVGEVWSKLGDVADAGDAAAIALLERLDEMRHGPRVTIAGVDIRVRRVVERATREAGEATYANAAERAETALTAAGAHVHGIRALDGRRQLEARFQFGGERFITIADAITLQIIDAGICLVDHGGGRRADDDLTLDSLPSAIREAMTLGELVITRR